MEVLNCLVSKHFPKLSRGTVRTISFNIHMVLIGLKPSFLIDTIAVEGNLSKLHMLLKELAAIPAPNNQDVLLILLIKDDYFLVNIKESLKRLEKERYYIDVSDNLQLPKIIDNSSVRCLPWM